MLAITVVSSGCGGGGGGGDNPPPPPEPPGAATLTLEIGLKQLRFSWPAVTGVTSYQLLANTDGASGFTQVGDDIPGGETSVAFDVSVHLHDWANARYMLDACNSSGCTGSNELGTTLDDMLEAIGYFKNSNHEAGDGVTAVELSADGQTLVIGSPGERSAATGIDGDQVDNSVISAGAAYVYRRVNGMWVQQAYLKASNAGAFDSFGVRAARSADGRTLAVAAFGESSSSSGVNGDQDDNSFVGAGAVYVFVQDDNGAWSQQAYVKASDPGFDDAFGFAIDLSADGDTLAVGAPFEESLTDIGSDLGATYVFRRNPAGTWSQRAYIRPSSTEDGDAFGFSVALDGNGEILAVGAPFEDSAATGIDGDQDDNTANGAGAVYVYTGDHDTDDWQLSSYVKAPNPDSGDQFGRVTLSDDGTTLVVGAPGEDSSANGIDGDQADNGVSSAGAAYVYGGSGVTWEFQTYLKAPNPDEVDVFGDSVTLSGNGNTLAVSARNEAGGSSGVGGDPTDNNVSDAGAVYLFRRDDNAAPWSLHTYVKATNPDVGDRFGSMLALSADGSAFAAASPSEASAATGIDGDQSDNSAFNAGAVYLY
ncbi:MAG: FG-GAP repeat protein [Pseudomonadota bacterium]|nr:FG-GAP repeat protein [Pseudomonadota bacterium]